MKQTFLLLVLLCVCNEGYGQALLIADDNLPSYVFNHLIRAEDGGLPSAPSTTMTNAAAVGPKSHRNSYLGTYAPAVISNDSINSYTNAMDAYGTAMDTWRRSSEDELRYRGRRFAVGLATAETRQYLSNLVLPTLLHQDPRYVPANIEGSFGERMWQAVRSIAITHSNSGSAVPNYSKLGGTIAAAYIGQAVYARQFDVAELHSGHFAEKYIAYSLAGDLATNTSRELIRTVIKPDIEMAGRAWPSHAGFLLFSLRGRKVCLLGAKHVLHSQFRSGCAPGGSSRHST